MKQPAFVGPSYTFPSLNVDCQRTVNLFPKLNEIGTGKNQEIAALVSVPGLLRIYSGTGEGRCRGLYRASNGRMFAVLGTSLWELSTAGVPTTNRGIVVSTANVSMTDNGIHLFLVDGASGYRMNFVSNVLIVVNDTEFPNGARTAAFIDSYFVVNVPDSRQFQISGLNDVISWDGLDVGSKEGKPDNLETLLVNQKELLLLGSQSYEWWFNSGDPDFPFARIEGAYGEQGIAAVDTLKVLDNTPFWLSQDANGNGLVVRVLGSRTPSRVSNFAVEADIKKSTAMASATAWAYQDEGNSFYVLNLPGIRRSWVLDIASSLWHERVSLDSNGQEQRSRAEHHLFTGSKHIVGDFETDRVYELRNDCYADDNSPLLRERVAPHFGGEKRITHNSLRLDMETGIGLTSGQGAEPKVMMQYSDDGGHSWSNEKEASAGKIGEKKRRVIWRRLGQARDRVYKVKVTDPVPVTLISSFLEVEAER